MKKITKLSVLLFATPLVLTGCDKPSFKGKGKEVKFEDFEVAVEKATASSELEQEDPIRSYVMKKEGKSKTITTVKRKGKQISKSKSVSKSKGTVKYSKEKVGLQDDSKTTSRYNSKGAAEKNRRNSTTKEQVVYTAAQYKGANYVVAADVKEKSFEKYCALSSSVTAADTLDEIGRDYIFAELDDFNYYESEGIKGKYYIKDNVFTVEFTVDVKSEDEYQSVKETGEKIYQIDFTSGKLFFASYEKTTNVTEYKKAGGGYAEGDVVTKQVTKHSTAKVKAKKASVKKVNISNYTPIGF